MILNLLLLIVTVVAIANAVVKRGADLGDDLVAGLLILLSLLVVFNIGLS